MSVSIDANSVMEELKLQRNAYADQCALAGATIRKLEQKNAELQKIISELEQQSKPLLPSS